MACCLTLLLSTLEDLESKDLKKFRLYLSEGTLKGFARMPRGKLEDSDATHIASLMTAMYGGEKSLKITLLILRKINHNELAEKLEGELERTQINVQDLLSDVDVSISEKACAYDESLLHLKIDIQADLKRKFRNISEGVASKGRSASLNDVFVEVYITEGGTENINDQHEVRQIEMVRQMKTNGDTLIKCSDLFKCLPEQKMQITSVLTKGIAGIGKTVSVQKFILDWAEQKSNDDIAVIVPLPFRDLNRKRAHYSLTDLLRIYAPPLKRVENLELIAKRTLLILDGLDECRHTLDFQNNPYWSDISMPTSVGVLLTNLIKGNLLSPALIWITSRPAAASQIPSECIHRLTEVRGFGDSQKEEYFRKRIKNEIMANSTVKHIKTSRTLYIMCHIPIFCWIAATVFENMFDANKPDELPQTLTEMYTHFLIIQTCMKNRKYNGADVKPSDKMSNSDKEMIMKLGELAFSQLSQGNLIFYEDDLKECGIDSNKASEYSSLCTEIFREENGLYSERVFCFIHLSLQEFLAAVYVHVSCVQKNVDVLTLHRQRSKDQVKLSDVHKRAVEKALQSPKGQLDLFLRFLLGLSRENKQTFLHNQSTAPSGIVQKLMALRKPLFSKKTDTNLSHCVDETINFIKQKIRGLKEAERTINMLHCLSELKDNSLVTGILNEVVSGKLSRTHMEPDKCSALTYVVLMSGEVLEVFDLKKFKTSAIGQQRLLCALKACKHGRLARCKLTAESCEIVASALQSENSPLTDLELSKNCIGDEGMRLICAGLTSSHCNLAKLRMDGCSLSAEACKIVALALQSENSTLRELDLSYNNIGDEGVKFLCTGLTNSQCKLAKLSLARCALTVAVYSYVALAVEAHSTLTELNLSHNKVTDLGMERLCNALMSAQCRLSSLKVAACDLTSESCKSLTKVLQSETSSLSYLNLNFNDLEDLGVRQLYEGLINANSKIQVLKLSGCSLTEDSCEYLAYVLQSLTSKLTRLVLHENDLQNTGVMLLSAGLQHANCKLQSLGLTGCGIEEDGVFSLASALDHNPSHLQELYLNFNTLGAGMTCLLEQESNPEYKLHTLITNYSGDKCLHPGPKKYFYELTLDDTLPLYKILLSHEDRTMFSAPAQTPDYEIMLCKEPLTKKCYWEVEVSGDRVEIGVSSRTRSLEIVGDQMGKTGLFPCLVIYLNKLHGFLHNGKIMAGCPEFDCPHRIGLYLDKNAEFLAFYSVCEDKLTLLGKFSSTDICKLTSVGKLFAAFRIYSNSAVKLCGP